MRVRDESASAALTEAASPIPVQVPELPPHLLGQLLEVAVDAIWMRDVDGVFRMANSAACSIMGGTHDEIVGRSIFDTWGEEVGARLAEEAGRILAGGQPITVEEQMFDSGRGELRTFLSNKVPVYAPDGTPLGILGVSRDITDRKRSEDELRASEARLAQQVAELNALYASAPIGLGFFSRDHRYLRVNEELARINGLTVEEHIGRTVREVLSDAASLLEPLIDRVFETGEAVGNFEVSGESPRQPGVLRHWLAGVYPVRTVDGAVDAVGAWVVEISERKAAEQREHLLAREVDHRAKNLLAVVQSIVQLSRASDVEEFKEGLTGRIQSLARAHSLLADSRWQGVDLAHLVAEELAPFCSGDDDQVQLSGAPLMLRPSAAQSLALVLHELATNAAKYGALSVPGGRLALSWRIDRSAEPRLEIDWVESGGPQARQPESYGFGARLIETSVQRQLRGRVERHWRSEGLSCRLWIPAAHAVAAPPPPDPA